ncbi:MAG: hypothetical protein ACMG6E_01500, partial [Candidatus Roizmanbacteria bacterium]
MYNTSTTERKGGWDYLDDEKRAIGRVKSIVKEVARLPLDIDTDKVSVTVCDNKAVYKWTIPQPRGWALQASEEYMLGLIDTDEDLALHLEVVRKALYGQKVLQTVEDTSSHLFELGKKYLYLSSSRVRTSLLNGILHYTISSSP